MDVLFVPGLNCTARLFSPQIAALERQFTCHVADHGVADTIEAIAVDILAKAPARFVLVALSMGGYVACEIMRQAAERVQALALLDTRAEPDTAEEAERRRRTIAMAKEGQFDQLHAILWPRLVHPSRVGEKALEEIVIGMMRETGAERFIRQQSAVLNRRDYRPVVTGISIPTTIIVGQEDLITPPSHAQWLHHSIKGSTYLEIAECGHLSSLEKAEEVNRAVLDLLNKMKLASN